jgi:prepilin-type N-terminal cleavage/methylation domain-containing protein
MSGSRTGFTLIELLVVIAIIAILVTGACAAFNFAIQKTREVDTQSMARTVANAVEQFQREYDQMPQPTSATRDTDCNTDTTAAEGLLLILTGKDKTQNPRGTDFLTDLKAATLTGKNRPVDGLVRNGETLELVDPWGTPYKVTLDLNADGLILNPNEEEQNEGTRELHKSVIVYSAGKDRDFSTWKDNVTSWRSK